MPDLDDFYAFKSTGSNNGGGGGSGCLSCIIIGLITLWIIGKLFG